MIWSRIATYLSVVVISISCLGQDLTSGGRDSIIAGPFGEPRMVMSEGGEWSHPIKVFANKEVETFVPDITSQGWVSWHISEFRQKGIYFTYLYTYHRNTRKTGRETIYVDVRTNRAIVVRPLQLPFGVEISTAPLELSKSIAQITTIVRDDSERFHGMTAQESVLKEKLAAARMALCAGAGVPNPDCSLSDSDFLKKHPIYSRDCSQLGQYAAPGINCENGVSPPENTIPH